MKRSSGFGSKIDPAGKAAGFFVKNCYLFLSHGIKKFNPKPFIMYKPFYLLLMLCIMGHLCAQSVVYDSANNKIIARLANTGAVQPPANEKYDLCWIYPNGSFVKYIDNLPVAGYEYPVASPPFKYATCFVTDKYGDDDDLAVLMTGGDDAGISYPTYYNENPAPLPMTVLMGAATSKIQTVFGGDMVKSGEIVMLILTVGNYDAASYKAELLYNPSHLVYQSPTTFPNSANEYASFGKRNGHSVSGQQIWDLTSGSLAGKERNIYIVFKIKQAQGYKSTCTLNFYDNAGALISSSSIVIENGPWFDPLPFTERNKKR